MLLFNFFHFFIMFNHSYEQRMFNFDVIKTQFQIFIWLRERLYQSFLGQNYKGRWWWITAKPVLWFDKNHSVKILVGLAVIKCPFCLSSIITTQPIFTGSKHVTWHIVERNLINYKTQNESFNCKYKNSFSLIARLFDFFIFYD